MIGDTSVFVGFAQAGERGFVAIVIAALKVDRMAKMSVAHLLHLAAQRLANMQQQRRNQRDQAKRVIEHHQSAHAAIPEQAFRSPKQAAPQTTVNDRLSINLGRYAFNRQRILGTAVIYELAGLCYYLRNHLYRTSGVVGYIAVDGPLSDLSLKFAVDVGRRRHDGLAIV